MRLKVQRSGGNALILIILSLVGISVLSQIPHQADRQSQLLGADVFSSDHREV
jgi:hypothetical protein